MAPAIGRHPRGAALSAAPPRVVLDTNVCLDLLLFRDPATAALAVALHSGDIEVVSDSECRAEWQRVLGYPVLALDLPARLRLCADYDARVRLMADATTAAVLPLPRCADPDDQKFLELARRAGARWLLTRDRALLALSRRTERDHGFAILTPQQWQSL